MGSELRRADRVNCRLSVRLRAAGRPCIGWTVNLSRVGLLLSIHRDELGIPTHVEGADVLRAVSRTLGDVAIADLHYEVLGGLVCKGVRVMRVAVADDPDLVELGCEFSSVLSPEEIGFLGLDLPEVVEGADVAEEDPIAARVGYLCAEGEAGDTIPLAAPIVGQDQAGLVLRIADPRALPMPSRRRGVGARYEAITDAYGARPRLLVLQGAKPIWAGGTRVRAVEAASTGRGFDVHLGFDPPLSPAARARFDALAKRSPELNGQGPVDGPVRAAARVE